MGVANHKMRIHAKANYALCGINTKSKDWATQGVSMVYLIWCSTDPNITLMYEERVFSEFLPGINFT